MDTKQRREIRTGRAFLSIAKPPDKKEHQASPRRTWGGFPTQPPPRTSCRAFASGRLPRDFRERSRSIKTMVLLGVSMGLALSCFAPPLGEIIRTIFSQLLSSLPTSLGRNSSMLIRIQ